MAGKEGHRCLAVRQPWAWAIAAGLKDIENRTWQTDYRGPVAILASSAKAGVNAFVRLSGGAESAKRLNYGALIGVADLVDIEPLSQALEANPWAWGPYCWRFANARVFETPIPAKGKLNLFRLGPELVPKVDAAVVAARPASAAPAFVSWMNSVHAEEASARAAGLFASYLELQDGTNLMRLAHRAVDDVGDSNAFVDRALAKWVLEDSTALADADRAVALDEKEPRAYLVRGLIYESLGNPDHAAADGQRADELERVAGPSNMPADNSED